VTDIGIPNTHHLDRRCHAITERISHLPADALLAPTETAEWLGVCKEWLAIGWHKGYGPTYLKLAPGLVRYRIGDIRTFLEERVHKRAAEYTGGRRLSEAHRAAMKAGRARRRAERDGGPEAA
jgi:hypothetical protein